MHRLAEFERNRESILHAYSQIGILELRLRSKVPMALAEAKPKQEYWFENLSLNEKGVEDLKRARQQKPILPEDTLSLSFWRYLLSNRHYGDLWLPHLYKAFPKVESPKSHGTFKAIDQAMNSSLRLRNKIAHYNLDGLRSIEHSVKKTEWLIQIMGD